MVIYQHNWNVGDRAFSLGGHYLYTLDYLQWVVHGDGRLTLLDRLMDGTIARLHHD